MSTQPRVAKALLFQVASDELKPNEASLGSK